ncbi:Tad domain-containing protein [Yoonia sp.]|uniref:Tad domain-containing protein n=1 Tax=Yoonia sp. TaxID=2212373 RepID=UPI0025EA1576|nr:Tad domain-containing protein [Yoonia sp.]
MRTFRKNEDGGIIVLSLLLLIVMLVMGGMAVDFMRFESRRAQLQSVSDRAVLAAANLSQTIDSKQVVIDYFEKAGFADAIVGEPIVVDKGNSRSVRVKSELDINTFYLRLIGMDTLSAPAEAAAIEGIGKVEISLVLDISGSMRNGGSTSKGRFGDMQKAAKAFANKVLDPKNGGQITLNIIPYAGMTNPGPEMFDFLNGKRYATPVIDNGPDGKLGTADDVLFPQVSSCLDFEDSDWGTSGLPGKGRDQVPHFMVWAIAPAVMDWGWCPQDVSAIRYAMTDAAEVATFIDGIRMHDGTGTHYGMKYALAALDPATQPAFAHLNAVNPALLPDEFKNRPAPWDDKETKKIIVLMTDGAITQQFRPKMPTDKSNLTSAIGTNKDSKRGREIASAGVNVNRFNQICSLAKHPSRNVEVYTVAFEVSGAGATQMRNCASDPSMYFPASGAGLVDVFEDIAEQITDLRLSL